MRRLVATCCAGLAMGAAACGGGDDPEPASPKIAAAAITVRGDRAAALLPGEDGATQLVREDGRWRVDLPSLQSAIAASGDPPAATPAGPSVADSSVKSDARNAVSTIESCAVDRGTYAGCDPSEALGPGSGPVELRNATTDSYEVIARAASGNTYRILRAPGGTFQRLCTTVEATSSCRDGTW